MPNPSSFQRIIAFLTLGVGLIAVGVASMTLITLRQSQLADQSATNEFSTTPAKVDYPAPALVLTDLDGNPVALTDYLGQTLLVNMWATWCPPCREEMPTLQAFYNDYSAQGFVLIGLNDGETEAQVREFVDRYGLAFPIWLDPEYASETAFKTMNLPSSFVIDRSGQVRLQWVGAISRPMLDEYVAPIIEE
ncbi:MAG: redoxin domain-containing protein [Chloroflexota bacterium]